MIHPNFQPHLPIVIDILKKYSIKNAYFYGSVLSDKFDDDSDLVQLVIERMANDDSDYVELDMVNHPPHYKDESGIECIEVTSKMQFCGGNCFKYLYRAYKNPSDEEAREKMKELVWIKRIPQLWEKVMKGK